MFDKYINSLCVYTMTKGGNEETHLRHIMNNCIIRRAGNTHAAIHGVKNTDNAVLVVNSMHTKNVITDLPSSKILTINELEFDHTALDILSLDEISAPLYLINNIDNIENIFTNIKNNKDVSKESMNILKASIINALDITSKDLDMSNILKL